MKLRRFMIPFWGYSFGILMFVLLVKFGFISTEAIGINVSSLEIVLIIYALILGLIQVARQTIRLKRLSAIATDLGNGHMSKRSGELAFDSIGNLAHAINKMADQIQKSIADLREVGQNLESQNDELHEVLKTEARFGAFLESIAVVDTGELAKTGLRAVREVAHARAAWLATFDPENHQQVCYQSTPGEFRTRPDTPCAGNMREISAGNSWEKVDPAPVGSKGGRAFILQIPVQFDDKPLGVIFLEMESELEGRIKRLLGNYIEAFSNALSNCISYQAALRQSIRLEELNKELLLADQNRGNFVARMSHELRTPLNSIIGFSKIMEKNKPGNLTDLDLDRLEKIHRNGNHLLQMINNILDLSKVEAGEMHLEYEWVHVDEFVTDVVNMLQPQAEAKRLYLHKELSEPGLTTFTDGFKLRQVLMNLVGNAIKFTHAGGVKIKCMVPDNDAKILQVEVEDTGIGIPEDRHEKIFKAFNQADHTTAQEFGGTGLGLTISRSIVHLLGGTLELSSNPGKGSVFKIQLPLRSKTAGRELDRMIVKK